MQKKYKNSVPLPLHLPVSLIQSQNKSARSWGGGGAATWLWGVVVEGPGALRAFHQASCLKSHLRSIFGSSRCFRFLGVALSWRWLPPSFCSSSSKPLLTSLLSIVAALSLCPSRLIHLLFLQSLFSGVLRENGAECLCSVHHT